MIYIIILLVIIGILSCAWSAVSSVFEALAKLVGGKKRLVALIAAFIIAFLLFSLPGILILAVILAVSSLISKVCKEKNEVNLRRELEQNCRYLGYMNAEMWREKLPYFAKKKYPISFDTVTNEFATQMEQQNIRQSDEWFQPFKEYMVTHQAATVTKMLNEVQCKQMQITHVTKNWELLNTRMLKGAEAVSGDVPALFKKRTVAEFDEYLFAPTEYLRNQYEHPSQVGSTMHTEELNMDDL